MNKEQKLGYLRELLMGVGAALITFGLLDKGFDLAPALGSVMALASLVLTVMAKEGRDIVFSLGRKFLSALGGAMVAYGISTPEQVEAVMGVLLPVISMISSAQANGNGTTVKSIMLPFAYIGASVLTMGGLSGCVMKLNTDGSKEVLVDPVAANRVIEIIATK